MNLTLTALTRCEHTARAGRCIILADDHPGGHIYPPPIRTDHYWRDSWGNLVSFALRAPTVDMDWRVQAILTRPDGSTDWAEMAGCYRGVRADRLDPRLQVHYFEGGHIRGTEQRTWSFLTAGTGSDA